MIFPVNFIIGAAVGAVSTYVYKDEKSKQWLRETGSKIKNRACSFVASPIKPKEDAAKSEDVMAEEKTETTVTAKTENTNTAESKQKA